MARKHRDVCRVEVAQASSEDRAGSPGRRAPVRFRWRGRSYRVVDVLASWDEAGSWWVRSAGGPAAGLHVLERQVWRVAADRRFPSEVAGIYDLVHEPGSGRWWLTRVWD